MDPFILMSLSIGAAGLFEQIKHERAIRAIPIRVHVNGTRGKSSVTRLIAAALRGGGMKVLAKTTGSAARMILPDGEEVPLVRRGPATILEYIPVLREAARRHVDAAVIECMAVRPEYQWFAQHRLIKATHLVITNTRQDHMSEMGSTEEEIARSLCTTVPQGGIVFTTERSNLTLIRQEAQRLGSAVLIPDDLGYPSGNSDVVRQLVQNLPYPEFEENISLALAVARCLGIPEHDAVEGMMLVKPDPGALKIIECDWPQMGVRSYFISAFAANDVQSAETVVRRVYEILGLDRLPLFGILNCRSDRVDRTIQWMKAISQGRFRIFRGVIGIGPDSHRLKTLLPVSRREGWDLDILGNASAGMVMNVLQGKMASGGGAFGLGNISGIGMSLVNLWERMGRSLAWKP